MNLFDERVIYQAEAWYEYVLIIRIYLYQQLRKAIVSSDQKHATMKRMRRHSFVLFTFVCINASSQSPSYSDAIHKMSSEECLTLLATYRQYWIADSLCTYGFREIFAWEFITRLDSLAGIPWTEVYQYLGKPDHIVKNREFVDDSKKEDLNKGEVLYRYILTPNFKSGNRYKALGVKLLHIRVVDGRISWVGGQENDG